jgi:hypothetical protein
LKKEGMLSQGTIKSSRTPGNEIPKEADMKKKGRGAIIEQVATVDGIDLSAVSWFDSMNVNTLATYVDAKLEGQRKRFFKKEKTQDGSMSPSCHYIQQVRGYSRSP